MKSEMRSVWDDTVEMPSFPKLFNDIHTDVLIIGGGISGILTAYLLTQNGINCVIAEKDRICSGTTRNTTAKITIQHGLIYHKIIKSAGVEAARKYLAANENAFAKYAELCSGIKCDYEIKDNYVYSTNDRKAIEDELSAFSSIGYYAELCEYLPIPVKNVGAVKVRNQAQFNPLKFIAGISKELNIYEHTFVREMAGNTAITDHGKIHADNVVVATHFPFINKHGSYYLKLYQHRSYMLALEKAQDVDGMYVDENKTGMSFRNYGDLLLLGGGGNKTGKQCGGWTELRSFSKNIYPASTEKYHWAAQDCMSLDTMPYIGAYSKSTNNLYVSTGFNKWGITGSMVSAMLLCDMISGRQNDYASLFSPSRSMLKPQLLANGFEAAKGLLSVSKKRCPHLGCALQWNAAERSWDCPCHGSRFTENGDVIDNPANGNLG